MINSKLIGKRIQEVRTDKKISQAMLAELTDISDVYMSNLETGKRTPSLEVLVKIANALGTTTGELLYGHQVFDEDSYVKEINVMLTDCSQYERRVIFESIGAIKKALKKNKSLVENEVINSVQFY